MSQQRLIIPAASEVTLSAVLHQPEITPQGAAILCHGMESGKDSEKLIYLAEELAKRGMLALRFDFRYAGASSGQFADTTFSGEVEDLHAVFEFIRRRQPGPIGVFGSSLGGTVALQFAAIEPSVAAIVTLAAPLHPEHFPHRMATPEQLRNWRQLGYTIYHGQRLNLTLLEDFEKLDVASAARRIRCPVLVLHGDADQVVPVAEAHELIGCLTAPKHLSIYEQTGHRFSDPPTMRRALAQALDWLTQHVR